MSRLYASNLPRANRVEGGKARRWNSSTSDDLPVPELPETEVSSEAPLCTRSSEALNCSLASRRPYSLFGINSRLLRFRVRTSVPSSVGASLSAASMRSDMSRVQHQCAGTQDSRRLPRVGLGHGAAAMLREVR